MTRVITLITLVLVGLGGRVYAQTATPHPNALSVGMYQFEDLTAPEISLSGTGWNTSNIQNQPSLGSNDNGDTLTFWVTSNADYVIVNRDTRTSGVGEWSICVDANPCQDVVDSGMGGFEAIAFELYETNSEIVFTKTDNDPTYLDFMQIILDPDSIEGATAESTPDPAYTYGSISGTAGDIETRFDMLVTAGDVALSSLLLFLLFSLWCFLFLWLFVGDKETDV